MRRLLPLLTVTMFGLLAAGAVMLAPTAPAQAQAQALQQGYFDERGEAYGTKYYVERPQRLSVSLARDPALPEDNFILRIAVDHAMTGCPRMSNLESEIDYSDTHLNIWIKDYKVDMRNLPQYAHYECGQTQNAPAANLVFSKDDLINNNTQIIRMRVGQISDFYDVSINERRVSITPSQISGQQMQYYRPLRSAQVRNPLKRWFYPEGTVMLYAPDAAPTADIADAINNMARQQGLRALQEIYPDFTSPLVSGAYFYYVDEQGTIAEAARPYQGHRIGAITTQETIYGILDDEIVTRDIPVYAKKPGMYD